MNSFRIGNQGSNLGSVIGLGARYYGNVADDAVIAITPPRYGGIIYVHPNANSSFPAGPSFAGLVHYDVGGSLNIAKLTTNSDLNVYTTALTGTTGTDGDLNIGVQANTIYIENRMGQAVNICVTFL